MSIRVHSWLLTFFQILRDFPQHVVMQEAVGGEDAPRRFVNRTAVEACHFPAGLLHDQSPRLIVPRLDVKFPIQIDAAVRHMAQINRRAAAAAEALQFADHFC